ncbi:hypothetical protein JTB14_011925 [Gonioctena quinquepunctata]|nr:hypothetical protein JTB14_011925 [Gonioctena quinquepunctata]
MTEGGQRQRASTVNDENASQLNQQSRTTLEIQANLGSPPIPMQVFSNPVMFLLKSKSNPSVTKKLFNYSRTDWAKFRLLNLKIEVNSHKTLGDIVEELGIVSNIQAARKKATKTLVVQSDRARYRDNYKRIANVVRREKNVSMTRRGRENLKGLM